MTPKKSVGLQLRVVMCLIILVGVRVTNVFVPIYSKKIVDALTEKIFAWQLILAFVGLKLIQGELFLKNFIISFFLDKKFVIERKEQNQIEVE